MTCPTCGAPVQPGTKFCNECGSRVVPDVLRDAGVPNDPLRAAIEGTLAGQYDFVRLLGRGGMGAVYLARDRALERAVAIKVLPPDVANTTDALERFRREARTVANLTHPNIVPLYAFGEAQRAGAAGIGYYVMGYVRGESLAARLGREGRIPPDETRRILAELADALDYAHRQGVVHRDIKPDNILLDDASGRPMLTDFGIAKGRDVGQTLTQVGTVMGTPHYMAPEQAAGERDVDGRSDLYSLGVVGYAMLAGRVPFEGKGLHEILLQHVTTPPPPLAAAAPDAPEDLVAAVERCLQKNPAARWPDGRSLRQALGGDEGKDLPRELEPLAGSGLLIILAVATTLYLVLLGLSREWYESRLAIFWTLYPLFFASGVVTESRHARKEGFGWRRIIRVLFWQPKWWPVAWPQRMRRPGDLTPRFPLAVRRMRSAFSWGLGFSMLPLLFMPFLDPLTETPARHEPLLPDGAPLAFVARWQMMVYVIPVLLCTFVGGLLMLGTLLGSQLWGMRRGLTMYVRSRVVGAPLASSFWTRPEVAAILLPPQAAEGPDAREPRTPHELLRSVAEAADALAGPTRAVGSDAVAAARELLADIEAADRELAELGASLDPAEMERLRLRIAAIDAQGGEVFERRQMRSLLGTQVELLERVQERHRAAQQRRDQLHEIMRTLWSQLAELRVRSSTGDMTPELTAEVSARVRALLAEIQRAGPTVARVLLLALLLAGCSASPDGTADEHYARALEHLRMGSRANFFAQPTHALRARAELERAVELGPRHLPARVELARYYLAAPRLLGGGDAKAAEQIAWLRTVSPARAALLEGWRRHHRGDARDASRLLGDAARQYPDSAGAWFALAHALRDQDRNDEAAAALRRGLALRPDYSPGLWQLGLVGATTGTHLAAAESSLVAYLETTPAKGEPALHTAHYRLGMVYEKQGRYEDARRAYRAALRLTSRSEYRDALRRVR